VPTQSLVLAWFAFGACALFITFGGVWLTRYGQVIAERTGMGGTWVGLVLLATVTSLPELVTGVSAVALAGAPNIAVGDALGSCVFNLAILSVLDWLHREESLFDRADIGHLLSAAFGTMLLAFVAFNLVLGSGPGTWSIGHVGLYVPVIFAFYFLAMWIVFSYEKRAMAQLARRPDAKGPAVTLRRAAMLYAGAALLVTVAGTVLPFAGQALAEAYGWNASFVGTIFVAFATSLPELVVTIAAVRIGALDMAIANLLGSNLFDVAIIAVDDLFYLPGPILSHVSPVHAASALSAIVMNGAFIAGLVYRPTSRVFGTVGWASIFLLVAYVLNAYLLFVNGA
jgi:cation:H+ antiporter